MKTDEQKKTEFKINEKNKSGQQIELHCHWMSFLAVFASYIPYPCTMASQ